MRSAASPKNLWSWSTPKSTGGLEDTISEMMFDPSGYLAVSTWGDATHTTPQVILFNAKLDTPVWSAGTPGSMV